jgi:hypothetical protein
MCSRPGKANINDIFTFLTVNEGVPQNVKCKKTKIVGFTYEKKKSIMFLFVMQMIMMLIKSISGRRDAGR